VTRRPKPCHLKRIAHVSRPAHAVVYQLAAELVFVLTSFPGRDGPAESRFAQLAGQKLQTGFEASLFQRALWKRYGHRPVAASPSTTRDARPVRSASGSASASNPWYFETVQRVLERVLHRQLPSAGASAPEAACGNRTRARGSTSAPHRRQSGSCRRRMRPRQMLPKATSRLCGIHRTAAGRESSRRRCALSEVIEAVKPS